MVRLIQKAMSGILLLALCEGGSLYARKHTNESETEKTRMLVGYSNVNVLVVIYFGFAKCYSRGRLGQVSMGSLCIISFNSR